MRIKNSTIAGMFGNSLEWFDFVLYAYFAPIFANLFFPAENQFVSLLLTFGVFASGFLIRPLGGIIIGYCGDRFGRKKALIFTIILMSFATCSIALLPTYKTIGIWAPILLTLTRLLQGFAVSGELNGSASFLIEHAGKKHRGLAGSLSMSSAFIGILIGSILATIITNTVSHAQLIVWGWRIPFLFAAIIGIIGLIVRLKTEESPLFKLIGQSATAPVKKVIVHHWKELLLAIFTTCIMAVGNYFLIAYFTTFLVKTEGMPLEYAMLINCISMFLFVFLLIFFGWLSDKIGRKPTYLLGAFGFIVLSYPIIWLLAQKSILLAFIAELLFVLILSPVAALVPTIVAEIFPTKLRNTGSSIGYNISLALFGGTAPLVAIALVKLTHQVMMPAWYLIGCALVSLIAVLIIQETFKKEL